jgi:hypothetical protein
VYTSLQLLDRVCVDFEKLLVLMNLHLLELSNLHLLELSLPLLAAAMSPWLILLLLSSGLVYPSYFLVYFLRMIWWSR